MTGVSGDEEVIEVQDLVSREGPRALDGLGVLGLVANPVNRVLGVLASMDVEDLDGVWVRFSPGGGVEVCLHRAPADRAAAMVARLGLSAVTPYLEELHSVGRVWGAGRVAEVRPVLRWAGVLLVHHRGRRRAAAGADRATRQCSCR